MRSSLQRELVLAFKGERFPRAMHSVIDILWWTNAFACVRLEVIMHLLEEFTFELLQDFVIGLFSSV